MYKRWLSRWQSMKNKMILTIKRNNIDILDVKKATSMENAI